MSLFITLSTSSQPTLEFHFLSQPPSPNAISSHATRLAKVFSKISIAMQGRRVISIVLIQKDNQCTKKPNKPDMQCLSPLKAGASQCVFIFVRSRCIQWLVVKVKVEIVIYPEVTGSVKRGKWNSHKLLSCEKRQFVTFFQFWYLVAVSHFKMDPFFGRNWKFSNHHGRHAFRFLGSERGVVFRWVQVTALTHEQNFMYWSEILLT